MPRARVVVSVLVLALASAAPTAAAEEVAGVAASAAPAPAWAIGLRVGGYGFRQPPNAESDHTGWTACRMNGIGVFVDRALAGTPFYLEGGLDTYFADELGTAWHDHGVPTGADDMPLTWQYDRVSVLSSVAGGVRFFPRERVSPYLQLGVGLELTRVTPIERPDLEGSFAMPLGFFGVGGDLHLGRLTLGASLRVNAMGAFDQGPGDTALVPHAELAAQGQFYAKLAL